MEPQVYPIPPLKPLALYPSLCPHISQINIKALLPNQSPERKESVPGLFHLASLFSH